MNLVVTGDGKYYSASIDIKNGGECKLLTKEKMIMIIKEDSK